MRLIDADELIKEFDPDGENLSPITVRLKIARQQTAYDVDKVVEQLEDCIADTTDTPTGLGASWAYKGAIEIVKAGGVNAT